MSVIEPHLGGLVTEQRLNLTNEQRLLLLKRLPHQVWGYHFLRSEAGGHNLMQADTAGKRLRRLLLQLGPSESISLTGSATQCPVQMYENLKYREDMAAVAFSLL